jgi:hypothetical protein
MKLSHLLLLVAPVALAACGDGPATGAAGLDGDGAKPASACAAGRLPLTGLCADADPALFIAVDDTLETVARGCVWRTEELQTGEDEALVFRAQDCTGEMWDKVAYSWIDRYVKARAVTVPEDQAMFVLEVLDINEGETAEDVARRTLAQAPESHRTRCDISPFAGQRVAGRAFQLSPNPDLKADLDALSPDEPWEACGPNGVTMAAVQFWEGRDRRALFHIVGQDEPLWDPASFTFYAKKAGDGWSRCD